MDTWPHTVECRVDFSLVARRREIFLHTPIAKPLDLGRLHPYSLKHGVPLARRWEPPSETVGTKEELMRLIKPIVLQCRWQVDT